MALTFDIITHPFVDCKRICVFFNKFVAFCEEIRVDTLFFVSFVCISCLLAKRRG